MKERIKETIVTVLGWVFLALGIAGLFLPVLQGILFILIGLALLSKKTPWAKKLLGRLKMKYPRIYQQMKGMRRKFYLSMGKLFKRG